MGHRDRKSTRLNSSHLGISYAVFCLKKHRRTRSIDATHIINPNQERLCRIEKAETLVLVAMHRSFFVDTEIHLLSVLIHANHQRTWRAKSVDHSYTADEKR